MIPVRCFTCNKVIANRYNTYCKFQKEGMENKKIFEKIGFDRYCCRRMFLGHIETCNTKLPSTVGPVRLHDTIPNRVYNAV